MATTLELVLLYLVAAVLGVVACRSLKLPPMLGYLVVGVVIGPNALALAQDSAGVKYLAEFGVVFLMFVIGLEFNLPKLRSMRTLVFGLGSAQVLATVAGAVAGHFLLVGTYEAITGGEWQMSWQGAVVLGSAKCSTCCRTGSGSRLAKVSPDRSSSGSRFAIATPAAVTMLVAPGPTDDVATMI